MMNSYENNSSTTQKGPFNNIDYHKKRRNLLKTIFILTITVFSFNVAKAQSNNIENGWYLSTASSSGIDSALTQYMLKFRNQEIGIKESL
jgi:hypothetical protein